MTLEPTEMKDKPQKWGLDMWNVVARHRNKEDLGLRPQNIGTESEAWKE